MQLYNDNRVTTNANLVDRLKVDGVRHLHFKTSDISFVSLQTRQNYLEMEVTAKPEAMHVHWSLNDRNDAHISDFRIMASVAAYSIEAGYDPERRRFLEIAKAIDVLFAQFNVGNNFSPTITHKGITYSLSAGIGDLGRSLKSESIWFTAKKSNK